MDRARLAVALSHANVGAFLRVIREGESSQEPVAYRMRWGGLGKPVAYFDDFTRHPRIFESTTGGRQSSAAGAYQIVATTYDSIAPTLGITDFSPESQDKLAIALIDRRGALDDIMAGRIRTAIADLRAEWTSLPGAAENNGRYTMERALAVYAKYGGRLAVADAASDTQPAAPIEDRSTRYTPPDSGRIFNPEQEAPNMAPLLALAIPLVTSLIEAFSPLAKQKIAAEMNRHSDDPAVGNQIADAILKVAQQVTGKDSPIQAVAEAQQATAVAQKVEEGALEVLDKLAPLLDKIAVHDLATWDAEDRGRDAAARRGQSDEIDLGPILAYGALFMVSATLFALCVVMGVQVFFSPTREPSIAMLTLVGPLLGTVFGVLASVYAYRFGTTRNNTLKDITVEQLSRRSK